MDGVASGKGEAPGRACNKILQQLSGGAGGAVVGGQQHTTVAYSTIELQQAPAGWIYSGGNAEALCLLDSAFGADKLPAVAELQVPAGRAGDGSKGCSAITDRGSSSSSSSRSLQWYSTSKLIGLDHWMVTIALVGFLLISASIYLSWRTYIIVHYFAKLTSVGLLYYAIEVLIFLNTLLFVMEICRPPREREQRRMPLDPLPPRVSIFVCCCNEALDVIQDTVVAAAHQDYPSNRYRVWVLDDGSDDNLKAWVEGVGVEEGGGSSIRYVRREKPKGKPHHFKAGNINNGLRLLAAELGGEKDEFVMLLDADMIPSTSILTRLLPHFENDNIAFVQCPQAFYNLADGDPLNDTALDFYNLILPCRDARNSAQCVGTGAVFRISSLQENGGFTTGSITEDFDTALHLLSLLVLVILVLPVVVVAFDLHYACCESQPSWAFWDLMALESREPSESSEK